MTRVIGAALLALRAISYPVRLGSQLLGELGTLQKKQYPPPLKDALAGPVVQFRFERFSLNELQSSVLGHSFQTCIVPALWC